MEDRQDSPVVDGERMVVVPDNLEVAPSSLLEDPLVAAHVASRLAAARICPCPDRLATCSQQSLHGFSHPPFSLPRDGPLGPRTWCLHTQYGRTKCHCACCDPIAPLGSLHIAKKARRPSLPCTRLEDRRSRQFYNHLAFAALAATGPCPHGKLRRACLLRNLSVWAHP